jgi:hypothetical protein
MERDMLSIAFANRFLIIVLANRDPAAADGIGLFAAHRLPAK